eukprot:SAG11_NODE_1881_length_4130_cov_2.080873_4_plen_164_part_00
MLALMLPIVATIMATAPSAAPTLLFVTESGANDMLTAAGKDAATTTKRFTSVAAALEAATAGDGLLVMADGMKPADPGVPQTSANATVVVTPTEWLAIQRLRLKVYVEFPRATPPTDGNSSASPPLQLQLAQTLWERAVSAGYTNVRHAVALNLSCCGIRPSR